MRLFLRFFLFSSLILIAVLNFSKDSLAECPGDYLRLWEICYWPESGNDQWIELNNVHLENTYDYSGAEIVSRGGSYSLPSDLEPVPPGGKILIYFDGGDPGINDYSFDRDNKAVLHGPAGDGGIFLGNPSGFCALYRVTSAHSKNTIIDFVAWGGEPGGSALYAVEKRIWPGVDSYLSTRSGPEFMISGAVDAVLEGGVLARVGSLMVWQPLTAGEATPGLSNAQFSTPTPYSPAEEEQFLETPSWFLWSIQPGASSFHLQVARDDAFTDVALDKTDITANSYYPSDDGKSLTTDTYWWRVRACNDVSVCGDWSEAVQFQVGIEVSEPPASPKALLSAPSILAVALDAAYDVEGQVVDTRTGNGLKDALVSIVTTGTPSTIVGSDTTDQWGRFTINVGEGDYRVEVDHDHFSFTRSGGFNITVDKNISGYFIDATGDSGSASVIPLGAQKETHILEIAKSSTQMCDKDNSNDQAWDQPHNQAHNGNNFVEGYWCWAVSSTMIARYNAGNITRDEIVKHVKGDCYGSSCGASPADEQKALKFALQAADGEINYTFTKWDEDDVVDAIDNDQPIFYVQPGHVVTLDAYEYRTASNGEEQLWCEFVNLNNRASKSFQLYSTKAWWRGAIPDANLTGRNSDNRVSTDTDGDGVYDLDEDERFPCGKNDSDSDDDGINDKTEIMSWVFPRESTGSVVSRALALTSSSAWNDKDEDGDGLDAEVDEDSDGGGVKDGDEDRNANAIWNKDADETDVYDAKDDGVLDLAFCIDTTGSMGDDIDQVKINAVEIVNDIEKKYGNFRIALIDYRDFPERTGDPNDYPAKTQLDFSTDKNTIVNAINGLSLGYGGDYPETVYSGIIHAIDNLSGWRKSAERLIIVMGDAPPLNPEPNTGYTVLGVAAKLFLGGIAIDVDIETGKSSVVAALGATDAPGYSGSISVYTIPTDSGAGTSFQEIADSTGGEMISAPDPSQVPDALIAAVEYAKNKPIASLNVYGDIGDTFITADASDSRDIEGCGIASYEWDWDDDNIFEELTFVPAASHTYGEDGFQGQMKVKVTNMSGNFDVAVYVIYDICPDDPDKTEPGICGCGVPDIDSDGDGALDCNDNCPNDANKIDLGQCGCGVVDTDTDKDGTADCNDNCPDFYNPDQADIDMNGVGDICQGDTGAILYFFDQSVANGTLKGLDQKRRDQLRLGEMRNLLETAASYIEENNLYRACEKLNRAYLSCNGQSRPVRDLVTGEAVPTLASIIEDLINYLECDDVADDDVSNKKR